MMRIFPPISTFAALVAVSVFVSPAPAQQPDWRAAPSKDFPLPGGNLLNQRYSALTSINPSNVARLGGAWMVHVAGGKEAGNMEATPVVVGGVMYLPTGDNIMALNAATGAVLWKHALGAGGVRSNRGVTAAEGKVFSAGGGNTLIALDQKTGELLWTAAVGDRGTTNAPATWYGGLVYMGVSGGEAGIRGFFGAFDAKTGKQIWGFWTIPGPGELGNNTWEGDSWKHGGGPVWTHPVIDPDLGTIYIAVGNGAPDNDGTERGGDNLFTASVVALDMKTGAYKWHFQEVHHDIWDYDNSAPPVLADIQFRGQTRKILMHGGKTGFLYILDRTNGKPLIGIEERAVPQEPRMKTAKTQPYPIGDSFVPTCPLPDSVAPGVKSSCVFGAYWDEAVVMTPGTLGGLSWAPMMYSPATHLIYVPGSIMNSAYGLRREAWDVSGKRLPPDPAGKPGIGFYRPPGEPRAGTLTAIDPTTNKIAWQKKNKYPMGTGSGFLGTASGLIFHGEPDGRMVAYDMKNGAELWSFQTGAGADAPAITYEVGGEQYVAILAGGNTFQMSAHGDNLWAFRLGGKLAQAQAPEPPPTTQPAVRGAPAQAPLPSAGKKKLLAIGDVRTGYQHDSVSHALATIERLGYESGAYETYIRTDSQLLTKGKIERHDPRTPTLGANINAKNLDYFDAIFFMGTGENDLSDQQKKDLLSFIRDDGKGFVGAHTGDDAFFTWPEFGEMIGGYFDNHPWGVFDAPVIVEDPAFPAMKAFAPSFIIHDEIYVHKAPYSRDKIHVLARLDAGKVDLATSQLHRTDKDFPVAWTKSYGKGRVFYSTFGHAAETWDNPAVQKMYLEAIKWAMGIN